MSITNNTSSLSKSSIFVGDLSIFCSENDLINVFTPFGTVLEAKIMRCEETHKNLCYGFVKFSNPSSAVKAMQEMNGKLLCGRPLRISWASHKVRRESLSAISISDAHGNNSSSIHVNYSANQIDTVITEDQLRKVFSKYGEVLDITVKKYELDKDNKIQKGYGFIHFAHNVSGILSALKCIEELKDIVIDEIHYKCDISHKLVKQLLCQQDSEVNKLIQQHYPGGIQELKDRSQLHDDNPGLGGGSALSVKVRSTSSDSSEFISKRHKLPFQLMPNMILAPASQPFPSPFSPINYYEQYATGFSVTNSSQQQSHSQSQAPEATTELIAGAESSSFNPLTGLVSTTNYFESNQSQSTTSARTDSNSDDSSTTNLFSYRSENASSTPTAYPTFGWSNDGASPVPAYYAPLSPYPSYYGNGMMMPVYSVSSSSSAATTSPIYFVPFPTFPRSGSSPAVCYEYSGAGASSYPSGSPAFSPLALNFYKGMGNKTK